MMASLSSSSATFTPVAWRPHALSAGGQNRRELAAPYTCSLNALPDLAWPETLNGVPSGLSVAGLRVGVPRGVVVGGDMTHDGGGQIRRERGHAALNSPSAISRASAKAASTFLSMRDWATTTSIRTVRAAMSTGIAGNCAIMSR